VPTFRRSIFLFVGLLVVAVGSAGRATALRHKPNWPTTVVLHPKWHVAAPRGVEQVLVSGRYAYIGGDSGSGALINERTGKHVVLAPPMGCYFDNANSAALGGSWVVATCNPPPPGPRYLYELYSIPDRTWTPFRPDVEQMFDFNADCKTGDPQCSASYVAVGDQWIKFEIACGYHCGPTTFAFQNIRTGQVDDEPADWRPGGSEIPDLNSPALTRTLCKPLKVPAGFTDTSTYQTLPGTIVLYGRFAVAQQWSSGNLNLYTYLERCGSRLRRQIDPNGWPFSASTHLVVWMTAGPAGPHRALDGLFLPTLRRVRITLPSIPWRVVLSAKHIYVITSTGRLYQATAPAAPKR